MKIYTKGGDMGTTSLLGGKVVTKNHFRLDAYGTIDELIAYCGLLRDKLQSSYYSEFIIQIQDRLMTIASIFATDDRDLLGSLPRLTEGDITVLESEIDKMEGSLSPLSSFVLPGGHEIISICHITRTVCRRAERTASNLMEKDAVDPLTLKYLNRLSDFFFVLSRLITRDLNIEEVKWKPKL